MRDVSHSSPLSGNAAVPANGSGGALVAPRLGSVRHGARGVPSKKHVTRGTGTRLCVDVPAPLLTRFDLAAQARGLARGCSVSGDVVPVQALQPVLAIAH